MCRLSARSSPAEWVERWLLFSYIESAEGCERELEEAEDAVQLPVPRGECAREASDVERHAEDEVHRAPCLAVLRRARANPSLRLSSLEINGVRCEQPVELCD
eukprot:scaffold122842_cov40-Tisochrysis_lutea.AAC.1